MPRRAKPAVPVGLDTRPALKLPAEADGPGQLSKNIPRETIERLERFVGLVEKWTQSINLVSRRDRELIWSRHVLDSLRFLPLIVPNTARGLDLGSGAGFPGLILAMVSGIPFDLVEADRRKAAFLIEAQRVTGAPVQVHCERIERLSLPRVPLITARALAPLAELLAYADRFLDPSGLALFAKGAHVDAEIAVAMQHWRMHISRSCDPGHPDSTVLAITGLTRI